MSKLRIVYATKTGHSKKLALAIGDALNIKAENITDKPVRENADLLYIVGGIYGGESLPQFLEFVKGLEREEIKSAALITSCASKKQAQITVKKLLEDKGIPVLDELVCQGSFLFKKIGHPDKNDVGEAVDFAVRLSERVERI